MTTPVLIVEDGTGVANANVYCSLDFVKNYCESRNLAISANDDELAQAMLLAMNYIESKEPSFDGQRNSTTQTLSYPRKYAVVNGFNLGASVVPTQAKQALAHATFLINDGVDLQPIFESSFLKEASVGSLTAKFSETKLKTKDGSDYFAPVDDILSQLYRKTGLSRVSQRHTF